MRIFQNALVIVTVMCLSLMSCQDKQGKEELAKFKESDKKEAANIETVKQFYKHLDKYLDEQERSALISMWATDSKRYGGSSDVSMTMVEMTPFLTSWYTAFPDLKHQLVNTIARDDYVVVQVKYSGTLMNEFMGIPASGKKIECKGVHIFRLVAGKIAELHFMDDDFTMFTQLGREFK